MKVTTKGGETRRWPTNLEVKVGQTWVLGAPGATVVTYYIQSLTTQLRGGVEVPIAVCRVGATNETRIRAVSTIRPPRYRLVRDVVTRRPCSETN